MNFDFASWSIRKPFPSVVLFTVLTLLGLYAYTTLPITRFPNIDVPIVAVTITQGGAAPAELETQVTKKVEDAVSGLAGVKHIMSSITDGVSTTTIEFRIETNTDRAVNDVKDAVARIRADLPRAIDEPITRRIDVEGGAIRTYAVSAPTRTIEEISWKIDDDFIRELQAAKGVASVVRVGGVEREIRVALDPDRLAALGVTAADVNRALRATNVNLAGGRGDVGGQEQSIRTLAGATTLAGLAAKEIALPGGRKARLDDLGTVRDSFAEPRQFARLDGKPVVAFAVFRAKGASDASVAREMEKRVAALSRANPDYRIELIDDTVGYTEGNFHSAMDTLMEGAALSVLVVLLFLRDWRATLISALALPLSAIPTFFAIQAMGFSLNLISLLGITLATGVLVDDAIVEIENIVRHMRMGKTPYRAAMDAAREIGLAVIAISLTIMAVFAPVSFMGGVAGQYFKQFGLTVAVAVFFSLLVARLITPMMAAYFMRASDAPPEHEAGPIISAYTRLVTWTVRWRWVTLALGLALFWGSMQAMSLLPKGFIPPMDEGRMMFAIELPPGSRLEDTRAVTDDVARRVKAMPEVASVFVNGGYMLGSGGSEVRKAVMTVSLIHKSKRKRSQKLMEAAVTDVLAHTPDIRFWFVQSNGQRQFTLLVAGQDHRAVDGVARALQSQMRGVKLIENPIATVALDRPELQIRPREALAAELGVTSDALSETIRVATIGDFSPNLARFDAGDRLIPIRVELAERWRADLPTLRTLKVPTARGPAVPLVSIADIGFGAGPASIERYDRTRRVAIEADLVGNAALGDAIDAVMALPAAKSLPPGVEIRQSGDAEIMGEVFAGFATALGAGLIMVFGVLVLLFASVFQPITILFSVPLALGGVIVALLAARMAFSMPVVIGFLMLVGIVTKNAIMLVDFAVERMAQGMSRLDAIVDAGAKRARPIVMTSIAMGAGMAPAAMALGDGGEFRAPMATAVIGGLIASTFLSLLFVPAVFTLLDSLERQFARLFGRFVGPREEENEAQESSPGATPRVAPPSASLSNAAE